MPHFNGISAILEAKWVGPNALFLTDASLQAAGGWSQGEYFAALFPVTIINDARVSINELEALAVAVGLKLWGHKTAGKKCLIQCDNNTTVSAINTGRAANEFMQQILREICYIAAINDAQIQAVYLPSKQNHICDSLSCLWLHPKYKLKFEKITTGLHKSRVYVPQHLFLFVNNW